MDPRQQTNIYRFIVLLVSLLPYFAASTGQESKISALYYLVKYGYVQPTNSSALLTEEGLDRYMKKAVLDFQAFAGLNQTGELDPETEELMNTPRCGVRDIIGHGARARRRKRYVLQGSKWRVDELTYRVSKYPSTNRLSRAEVDDQIQKAFQMWESVSSLKFQQKKTGSVHIDMRFESYEHGDGDSFDGPGGTLAHAFFPQYGGDIHMDDSEYWTIDSFKGTNLLQTVVHELGHSLGLSHSDVRSAIMAPFYKGWEPSLKLTKDDILSIQALYGESKPKPTPKPTPETNFPTTESAPDTSAGAGTSDASLCGSSSSLDAIVMTKDGTSYVFKGDNYWKLTADSVAPGYPRRIKDDWPGLPDNIDAAFTWQEFGATYFFKGDEYWKFENRKPNSGYPKSIERGFPGIPSGIDSAFVWGGNGKIYFTKGRDYWKFDPEKAPHVHIGKYPRDISMWGLPSDLDGSIQWENGKTYFFKAGRYWRFNDRKFNVDQGDPAFPRSSGEWWFGCPKTRPLVSEESVAVLPRDGTVINVIIESNDEYLYTNEYYSNTGGDEDLDVYEDYDTSFDSGR